MGVFFGFRAAQIFVIEFREDLSQYLFKFLVRNYVFKPRPVLVVLGGGDEKKIFRSLGVGKLVKIGRGERIGHLPGAIGAEIKEDNSVFVANLTDGLCCFS